MKCSIVWLIIFLLWQKSLKCLIIAHFGLIYRLNNIVFGALRSIRVTKWVTALSKFLRKVRLWLKIEICDHLIVWGLTRRSEHIRLRWLLNREYLLEVSLTVERLFTLLICSLLLCFGQQWTTWINFLIQHAHVGHRVRLDSRNRNGFFSRTLLEACLLLLLLLFKERLGVFADKLGLRLLLLNCGYRLCW